LKPSLLTLAVIGWIACLPVIGGVADGSKPRPPNLIVILADDLGYGDVGCYNADSKVPTPNIDRLAREGIRLTDTHSPSTVCTPSRYGLLTGRYCWRSRLKRGVLMGFDPPLIEPGRLTLPALLEAQGYVTTGVGKWHVGMTFTRKDGEPVRPGESISDGALIDFHVPLRDGPLSLGFQSFFGCSACPTTDWLYAFIEGDHLVGSPSERFPGYRGPLRGNRAGVKVPDFDFETVDVTLADRSVRFLEDRAKQAPDRPFFLYHAASAPHLPAIPARGFVGKSQAGPLGDFIHEFDWVVGRIVDTVDRLGLDRETLIIVTSDNGPETCMWDVKEKYGHDEAGGLRGMKRDNWEGGHRIPFLARWPGKIKPGSTGAEVICLTDLMATAAALSGAKLPEDAGEDSFNILPSLLGEPLDRPIREATVHHSADGAFAIRQGRWKLLDHQGSGSRNYANGSIPIVPPITDPDSPGQLYDLETDPKERENLYRKHPDIVRQLSALLERYKAEGRSRPAGSK
jgi:arylsulfatase A